jgi:hypothetical protein
MAYTQMPGRDKAENENINALTNGGKKKKVKKFNNETKETSEIDVVSGSGSDKMAKSLGNVVDFGKSQSQSIDGMTGKNRPGTNANTTATASTFGTLPKGFKGMAFNKSNKKVNFSNNNNDALRGEQYRIYK